MQNGGLNLFFSNLTYIAGFRQRSLTVANNALAAILCGPIYELWLLGDDVRTSQPVYVAVKAMVCGFFLEWEFSTTSANDFTA